MTDTGPRLRAELLRTGRWLSAFTQARLAAHAFNRGDLAECDAKLDEQRRAAQGDMLAELVALTSAALHGALAGRLVRARKDLRRAETRLRYLQAAGFGPGWERAALLCDWMAGDWESAEVRSARLEAVPPVPPDLTLSLRVELLRQMGRPAEAGAVLRKLHDLGSSPLTAWAAAGLDGDPAEALARLAAATRAAWDSGNIGVLPLVLHRTAEIAFRAGDEEAVARARADFQRLGRTDPAARVLGGLVDALAARDAEPARRVQALAEAEGMAPFAAECLTVRARFGTDADHLRRTALDRWREIGARPRCAELAELVDGSADGAVPLTARERELVGLLEKGGTNREIAAALHLSVKTVEAYLTRLYQKAGCTSRLELVIAAAQGRLG